MAYHRDEQPGSNHVPYNFTYADAAAREAATDVTAADLGKLARQLDDDTLWMLVDESPVTWTQVGGVGISGSIGVEEGNASEGSVTTIDFDDSDFNVSVAGGEADVSLNYGAGVGQPAEGNHGHAGVVTGLTLTFGNGVDVIDAGDEPPQYAEVPFAATVTSWKVVSVDGTTGSITFLVARAAAGTPTSFSEISGSSDPSLSTETDNEDTSISGDWSDVTLDAGDVLRVAVDGTPSDVVRVAVMLRLTRSL